MKALVQKLLILTSWIDIFKNTAMCVFSHFHIYFVYIGG